ncbi:hypothetical protein FOZ62_004358 [Perkinsus olseni]|uniref:Uncharacterized protein n=1 Tax=Perkinsus olseni TaxID=32597 RepID=A0A7J6NDS8_PEROL|nr:hypothetical protein FOZ62_004358 [Perkinsus olseni]
MPAAIVSAKGLTAFFFLRGGAAAAAVLWNEVKYPSTESPETTPVVIREKEGMKFGFSQLSKGELALLSFINLAAGAQYISALVDPSWASYAIIAGSTAAAGLFPKQLGSAALAVGAPLGLMTGPYSVPLLELLPVQLSLWYATSCVNYAFCHEGKSVPIAITGVAAFGLAAYLGGLHQVFTTCWFLNSSFLLWRAHNNGFEKADWKARRLQGQARFSTPMIVERGLFIASVVVRGCHGDGNCDGPELQFQIWHGPQRGGYGKHVLRDEGNQRRASDSANDIMILPCHRRLFLTLLPSAVVYLQILDWQCAQL